MKDFSGATSGSAQSIIGENRNRAWLLIQNLSDTVMYVNFGDDASAADGSYMLFASGGSQSFEAPNFVPTDRLSIYCASAGKSFTVKEGSLAT